LSSKLPIKVEEQLQKFFSKHPLSKYRKGEIILRPNDVPQNILYLNSGYVRMFQVFENGKELTLNIFRPGSYFSIVWAISKYENTFYFQAMTAVEAYRAPKDEVLNLLKTHPDLLLELTTRMVTGIYSIMSNVEQLLSTNAYKRVASILVILAKRFGEVTSMKRTLITLSLSHEDIAQLINLTRETTSIEMKKLMEEKLIFYKRRLIIVNDLEKLRAVSFVTNINEE